MLRDCTLPALYMPGTHLPKLDAQRLQCNGPLHLRAGFQATGLVDLSGADDHRAAGLRRRQVFGKGYGAELRCHNSWGGCVFATGFEAQGEVNLVGAKIDGQLDCTGGKFLAKDKALNCNGISVGASVFLRNEFEAHGKVNLVRAKIDGQLACTGGKFLAEGIALHCDAITVGADVFLRTNLKPGAG